MAPTEQSFLKGTSLFRRLRLSFGIKDSMSLRVGSLAWFVEPLSEFRTAYALDCVA